MLPAPWAYHPDIDRLAFGEDGSLVDLLSSALRLRRAVGEEWSTTVGPAWVVVTPPGSERREQGWKLHLSASVLSAPTVLARVLPILTANRCHFKFARSLRELERLNAPGASEGSSGKFLTIYPADDAKAVALAKACHEATAGMAGPRILSDQPWSAGSLVHARYGAFRIRTVVTPIGTEQAVLRRPDGAFVEDLRLGRFTPPAWVEITYIPGRPPDLSRPHTGCLFFPRCVDRLPSCQFNAPKLTPIGDGKVACHVAIMRYQEHLAQPAVGQGLLSHEEAAGTVFTKHPVDPSRARDQDEILRLDHIHKTYKRHRGFRTSTVQAVDDVSFTLRRGRVTALVGQSGSGKSTLARLVTGVERPDTGEVVFEDKRVDQFDRRQLRDYRKHIQMVFQDPFSALNPANTIAYSLSRPLINHRGMSRTQARATVRELLETVGLSPAERFMDQHPHQLSGGQRQRVVIARALASEPEIVIADEPISMLDVSIRAEILQLLDRLVRERQIAMLYITHDLLSARLLADDILVLNHGRVVERGEARRVITQPQDAYTQLLLKSIPNPFTSSAAAD